MSDRRGWVLEHRMVAYDLGLLTGRSDRRHVHHRDHDKLNNEPGNLRVLTPSEHASEHTRARRLDPTPYVRMREAGMSLPAIAAVTGTNTGTIHRVIRRWYASR